MADLSSVTDNYLPTASETFSDNLSGSISAGATTVPVNSAVEYADGETVVLTVDPGTANEATFVGKKDTGADQFIECIWTEGNTAVGHDAGATIIDYDSATHYNLLSEALQLIMNQDGTLKDDPIRTALGLSDASNDGWEVFPYTFSVSSGYNQGQNEYELTVANQDVRTLLSPGMKLRLERSTTAPTQCADFEASSSQYASRASGSVTGITFTDDFTCEAWIKPESYTAGGIVSRYDGTTGFLFNIQADGTLRVIGDQGANTDNINTYQAVPLEKWSHVAFSMDCSGNSYAMYINGISVTINQAATAATAIVQAGPLQIGAYNSTTYFDGKIADVRIWSAIRTATEIRDNMNQQLTGSETNLVGYWKLNGDFADSTTNANTLTASGGAIATSSDNPFSDTEYATITNVSYSAPNSTVTVFSGHKHNIPNMTLSSPYYSTQETPYGFPKGSHSFIEVLYPTSFSIASGSPTGITGLSITTPLIPANSTIRVSLNGAYQRNDTATASSYVRIYETNTSGRQVSICVATSATANAAVPTTLFSQSEYISTATEKTYIVTLNADNGSQIAGFIPNGRAILRVEWDY